MGFLIFFSAFVGTCFLGAGCNAGARDERIFCFFFGAAFWLVVLLVMVGLMVGMAMGGVK